jgi:hypothetical protein
MTTMQLHALSSAQAEALTSSQVCAIASADIAAITTGAYSHLLVSTPLILDLNGDGVKTLSISSGVKFDLFADGHTVNTGWVSSGDGLLVLDRNHDGVISDGSELFGSSTKLKNGERAQDGYAALREFDSNGDGVISNADEMYADLRVWIDRNSDGVSETGETRTLQSLGIKNINLNPSVGTQTDHGNLLGLTSSYETSDGATHAAVDVWFIADKGGTNASAGSLDAAIAALNISNNYTISDVVADVPVAAPMPSAQLSSTTVTRVVDLRTRVSSLAQAMGAFGDVYESQADRTEPSPETAVVVHPFSSSATLVVGNMVDVMKQFDSKGNRVADATVATAAPSTMVDPVRLRDLVGQGYLASAGK